MTFLEKKYPNHTEIVFLHDRPIRFDTKKSVLIGFSKDFIAGATFLFRSENGQHFVMECDPIGFSGPTITALSRQDAVSAWNRCKQRLPMSVAFPNLRPVRA